MRKRMMTILAVLAMAVVMTACSLFNCKEKDCSEEVYEDGYCKYHYYIHAGEGIIKDFINR